MKAKTQRLICILLAVCLFAPMLCGCESKIINRMKSERIYPGFRIRDGNLFPEPKIGADSDEIEMERNSEPKTVLDEDGGIRRITDEELNEWRKAEEEREKELDRKYSWEHNLRDILIDARIMNQREYDRRIKEGWSEEEASRSIDIRNKMVDVMIALVDAVFGDPEPAEEDWVAFLDSTWKSVSFSSSSKNFYASPECNLCSAVKGWMADGISGGVDAGTGNLVFVFYRKKDNETVKETMIFQRIDENHVLMTGDRAAGKTSETFERVK